MIEKSPMKSSALRCSGGGIGAIGYFGIMGCIYWLLTGSFYWPWDLFVETRALIDDTWDSTDESFISRLGVGAVVVHVIFLLAFIVKGAEAAVEGARENMEKDKQ